MDIHIHIQACHYVAYIVVQLGIHAFPEIILNSEHSTERCEKSESLITAHDSIILTGLCNLVEVFNNRI